MKFALLLVTLPAALGSILQLRAGCNADNCARAVTGTAGGSTRSSSRIQDCSSYQTAVTATAYPAAVTTTTTSGLVPFTITASPAGTTVYPGVPPAYAASACTGDSNSRYASACSCAGIPQRTSTAPVPTATVVVPAGSGGGPAVCSTFKRMMKRALFAITGVQVAE